jgi:hypothetical protein
MHKQRRKAALTALLAVALAGLGLASSAWAKLTGPYAVFAQCPYQSAETKKCLVSVIESGEVVLGSKKVPIVNPVTIQAGLGKQNEESLAPFIAPKNGVTISKTPQSVPGGLAGIVPGASSPPLVKALIKFFFENKLTGLTATLELARPVDEIKLSELHLAEEIGVAIKIPVKLHLENPFLGGNCYVGSSSSPIVWELTTGETSPRGPGKPIKGSAGNFEFLDEDRVLETTGISLVDNAWSAPGASGCGGILDFLVNPIVKAQLAAATAGHDTAILTGTSTISSALAVRTDDEENP